MFLSLLLFLVSWFFGILWWMEDPFDLSPPVFRKSQDSKEPRAPRRWGSIVAVISLGVVVFGLGALLLFAASRPQISADSLQYNFSTKVAFSNIPQELKTSDEFSASVSVTNQGDNPIKSGYLLVSATGADITSTIKLTDLKEGQEGYLRNLNESEKKRFENGVGSGFYWYIGDLGSKQTKSQQIVGKATGLKVRLETKVITASSVKSSCGFLNLSTCESQTGDQQIGYEAVDIGVKEVAKISLRSGYNFVSLPYLLTSVDATNLLSLLKDHYAYYFKPDTAEYLNLYQGENVNYIKPGSGIWIYSGNDQEVNLPANKSETNSNDNYTMNLAIGWNHLGNPFAKRIIMSADKIQIREVSDDGSPTGTIYSLKGAVSANIVSQPYVVKSKNFTDSSGNQSDLTKILEWKILGYESTMDPFVGFLMKAEKKVIITFPGRNIIAPGDLLSDDEKTRIASWIGENGFNEFGESLSTVYSGGVPQDKNGNPINRYDYILNKNPQRPWNR